MSKLQEALREKIEFLLDEKEEFEDALQRIASQLDLCEELLTGELEEVPEVESEPKPKKKRSPRKPAVKTAPKKQKRVPKKKSKTSAEEELRQREYDAAVNSLPPGVSSTTPDEQNRAINRFKPFPRPPVSHGNVTVGSTKGKPEHRKPASKGHDVISIDDDIPEEE